MIFQQLKRKKNLLKKCSRNGFGLLPNCIVKKKIVLQPCNCIARERARKKNCIGIVLQEKAVVGLVLYCKRRIVLQENACGWKIVLQYGGAVG